MSVENLAIWLYGYPSSFLLEKPQGYRYLKRDFMSEDKIEQNKNCTFRIKCAIRVLLWLFLLPISLLSLFLGKTLRTNNLILKPMGTSYWETLKVQWKKYIRANGFYHLDENHPEKYYRIITSYVYENSTIHAIKMDNYVALYGFLRSMSLIVSSVCVALLMVNYTTLFFCDGGEILSFSSLLLNRKMLNILILSIVAYLFFIAFLKFYRRYTLEAFSGFIAINTELKAK